MLQFIPLVSKLSLGISVLWCDSGHYKLYTLCVHTQGWVKAGAGLWMGLVGDSSQSLRAWFWIPFPSLSVSTQCRCGVVCAEFWVLVRTLQETRHECCDPSFFTTMELFFDYHPVSLLGIADRHEFAADLSLQLAFVIYVPLWKHMGLSSLFSTCLSCDWTLYLRDFSFLFFFFFFFLSQGFSV